MGRALSATGINIEDSLRLTSPIYRLELAFVSRLFVQNPDLYAQIEMSNPYGDEVRKLFGSAAAEWNQIIQARDTEAFRDHFEKVAEYFQSFSEEGMICRIKSSTRWCANRKQAAHSIGACHGTFSSSRKPPTLR